MAFDPHTQIPEQVRRSLENDFVLRFTTTGRRTGAPRTFETTFVWDGGRTIFVSGYPGKRDYVANLGASPSAVLHTVEGGISYDIPASVRVLRDREDRTGPLLAFIEHWASRMQGQRQCFMLVVRAVRYNRRLHLPWWGPFYFVRRVLDRMPCVEFTITGPPTPRQGPPPVSRPG